MQLFPSSFAAKETTFPAAQQNLGNIEKMFRIPLIGRKTAKGDKDDSLRH